MWLRARNPNSAYARDEIRISLAWAVAYTLIIGIVFITFDDSKLIVADKLNTLYITALLYFVALISLLLTTSYPLYSRWFITWGLSVAITLGAVWLQEPGFISLLVIPIVFAEALIGFQAVILIATVESMTLIFLRQFFGAEVDWVTMALILTAIWMMSGLMYAIYRPMRMITRWALDHYLRAERLLEESRDRKAELRQIQDELMRANWELSLLNERLNLLRMAADQAREAKSIFVAKVSHEFRTPLNMIIGLADLLLETPEVYGEKLPATLLEDIKIVQKNCNYLSELVDDVLDLSQTEAGQLVLHREWVDLAETVGDVAEIVHPLLKKKHLRFDVTPAKALPLVYCDRTRIQQVILNLASNAARFTDEGSVSLSIQPQDHQVVICVRDTGPGISTEAIARIFEPFFQGGNTFEKRQGGSGLGLNISKQFIELHGGQLWVESEQGAGSTFSFSIPIAPPMQHMPNPRRWISDDWMWHERTTKPQIPRLPFRQRIVICDNTGDFQSVIAHVSDETEIINTHELDQALEKLQQTPAHALVLNTATPSDLLSSLDQVGTKIKDTPIIGCSLSTPKNHQLEELGVVTYLTKPIIQARLHNAIQEAGEPLERILVVDDNLDVQHLMVRMLSAYPTPLDIIPASNGAEALAQLRQKLPDLLLLDIELPDMDGWEILKIKNNDDTIQYIPTIIISSHSPLDIVPMSKVLLSTVGTGISANKILNYSMEISRLLMG